MTATTYTFVDGTPESLREAVLADIYETLRGELTREGATGCVLHPTGKVRWLGGTFVVKRIVWAVEKGAIPSGLILVRTCQSERCVGSNCHRVESRSDFARWLGIGTGWRRQER